MLRGKMAVEALAAADRQRSTIIILFVKSGDHGQIINTNTKRKQGDKMW
jgi:hypothetical protein